MILNSEYDFYRMSDHERTSLIGRHFVTRPFKVRGKEIIYDKNKKLKTMYFPVLLKDGEFNYGKRQGLVFVTEAHYDWFRVGVCSPMVVLNSCEMNRWPGFVNYYSVLGDLDLDLDFTDISVRKDIIQYLKVANKLNVTYKGLLLDIQSKFGGQLS